MKLLTIENNRLKISSKALGIVYEKKYRDYLFRAEFLKKRIKFYRFYGEEAECFYSFDGENLPGKEMLATDYKELVCYGQEKLKWLFQKKFYQKRRF